VPELREQAENHIKTKQGRGKPYGCRVPVFCVLGIFYRSIPAIDGQHEKLYGKGAYFAEIIACKRLLEKR